MKVNKSGQQLKFEESSVFWFYYSRLVKFKSFKLLIDSTTSSSDLIRHFSQVAQGDSQLENVLNEFRPNLDVLRVEHTCVLDISNSDISTETIINLITRTLQSWSDSEDHNFLQLFEMFFSRLRNYNAVEDGT